MGAGIHPIPSRTRPLSAAPAGALHPGRGAGPPRGGVARASEGALIRSGGHGRRDTPDPIPNSAVKRGAADGTAPQGAGEQVTAGPDQNPPISRPPTGPHQGPRPTPRPPHGPNPNAPGGDTHGRGTGAAA